MRSHCGPVLVVDDDSGFRALVSTVLNQDGCATREAATGEEALDTAREEPPKLVILDVNLPGMCGYEVCRRLRNSFGDRLPVVFVSGERTQSFDRVAGFFAGGDDYLVKPFALDEFVARVRRMLERANAEPDSGARLTRREVEVLTLLGEGCARAEVARRLFISRKTVDTHVERIFRKLGVHNRAGAVAAAYQHRLLDPQIDAMR